ncbi:unnamed protein product [Didymodactylos carnosus]|uniref:Uncharacterized protein n=1 Tax=Didymodactylos carnosus TaxID=1234261 RepID=A0A815J2L1_9BILA|nr:unnamed protein product [Didymodactylos carnosus]CAF4264249.1 unnamed protein product [Didymodactylos carnosus]
MGGGRAFYIACQTGDKATVEKKLTKLKSNEICVRRSNGSTALHAAALNGHKAIVQLLVNRCCARAIRDNDGQTAYELAFNYEIQQLLTRHNKHSRFEIKPHFFQSPAFGLWRYIVNSHRLVECGYHEKSGVEERRACALYWIQTVLTNVDERNLMVSYFENAYSADSAEPLLIAMTEETDFHWKLNEALIAEPDSRAFKENELHGPLLIARNLFKAIYDGKHGANYNGHLLYAKATLTNEEIQMYKCHALIPSARNIP